MAFDKQLPYTHIYPVLDDILSTTDDDDEVVRQVKQLSLVTAQQDEQRRNQLCQQLNIADSSVACSTGSLVLQESNSLPELLGYYVQETPTTSGPTINTTMSHIARPRPHASAEFASCTLPRTSLHKPSVANTGPPPLPSVGPNASHIKTNPVHIPSHSRTRHIACPEVPPRPFQSAATVRSHSVSPPFHRANLMPFTLPDSADNEVSAHVGNDIPLISWSPPCNMNIKLAEFDLSSLDPFRPQSTTASACCSHSLSNWSTTVTCVMSNTDSKALVDTGSQALGRVDNRHMEMPSSAVASRNRLRSNDITNSSGFGMTSTPLSTAGLIHMPSSNAANNLSRDSPIHNVVGNPTCGYLWPAQTGNLPVSSVVAYCGSAVSSPFYDIPESQSSELVRNCSNTLSSGYSEMHAAQTPDDMTRPITISNASDLMDFSTDLQYLSLSDFDPLYSVDKQTLDHLQKFDSSELFWSADRLERQQVEQPPEAHCTQQPPEAHCTLRDSVRNDELQDPFSFDDLTLSLEKKRQRHAREQELRDVDKPTKSNTDKGLTHTNIVVSTRKGLSAYEMLQDFSETADDEIRAFLEMVARIKVQYSVDDSMTNAGFVISPVASHVPFIKLSVKVVIFGSFVPDAVTFTCDVNTLVSHVISHVLLTLSDDLGQPNHFILKVYGLSEYLLNDTALADYQYVQQCLNLDHDIQFVIVEADSVPKPFLRTDEDAKFPVFVPRVKQPDDPNLRVTKDKLNILMETYYKEVEKLRDAALQRRSSDLTAHYKGVLQIVRAMCTTLCHIETIDLVKALHRLTTLVTGGQSDDYKRRVSDSSSGYTVSPWRNDCAVLLDDLHQSLDELTRAVKALIVMYCRTFHTEFRFESACTVKSDCADIVNFHENVIVHIASMHRLPTSWKNVYIEYYVVCAIYHGGRKLGMEIASQSEPVSSDGTVVWDSWLPFESVLMSSLPREARLCFTLIGVRLVPLSTSEGHHKVKVPLGWVSLQIYNQQFELVQGRQLLCLWPGNVANPLGTNFSNTDSPHSVLLQINLPDFDQTYFFPSIPEALPSFKQDFKSLHPDDQEYLQSIIEKDALTGLTQEECDYLWEKRYYLYDHPSALPRVIQTVSSWSWNSLREAYTMIQEWSAMPPLESLQLLLPSYPDTYVRNKAVDQLNALTADDLIDLLPQLVQALKFECYHTSALARMLLEKAASNVRIAHHLYWLLKEAADDVLYRKRFQLLFGALLSVVGQGMRTELAKQDDFVRMLSAIADKVKAGKDKESVLRRELSNMWEFYNHSSVRLPLNPSLEVVGIDVQSCSYFTSFTCPLKLALKNSDALAGNIYVMFKAGDDLRQDMLTLQLIRIMDRLWLQEGLDLKMVTFRCQPTAVRRGLVELVVESETLRKIQVKGRGLAGSFKDRSIAEWLQVQNPTELDYQKAVDNFMSSCAGYCVATYVLGICDRHNDNIMIKHSGHIFHIDFAKFLGDAQMFGNIKRDRTPFVLTSDMAYVINGSEKPSQRFQNFVDICCRAFNILRKNSNLFINLLSLMTLSGIPGITSNAPEYVQRTLLPDRTDAEAVAEMTRMINVCLQSLFTQVNFFIHNLAQMKFSGHEEGDLLSFIPKTYSIQTDGCIKSLEMYGIQKRYSPDKHYVYIVRIQRESQRVPSYVLRRYSEFQELHRKLVMTFPLVRLRSLPGRVILGRAHVRTVAEARRTELELFLKELLTLSPEVAQHDLIYTFFHPMLRDEQDFDKNKIKDTREPISRQQSRRIDGSIKLNLFLKNETLTVMVMHVKDLGPTVSGEPPNPYVKLYLLPDPLKQTKKKTKIAKNTFHPTFNEMLMYRVTGDELRHRTLQVMVWSYDALKENEFLGAVHIPLANIDFTQTDNTAWHRLQTLHIVPNV